MFVFNISFSLFPFLYYKYTKLLEITQHFSQKNVLYPIYFNYILTYRILCLNIERSFISCRLFTPLPSLVLSHDNPTYLGYLLSIFLLTYLVFFFRKKRKEITTCRDYILYILLLYMNCIYIHIDNTFITCVCVRAQFCLLMR